MRRAALRRARRGGVAALVRLGGPAGAGPRLGPLPVPEHGGGRRRGEVGAPRIVESAPNRRFSSSHTSIPTRRRVHQSRIRRRSSSIANDDEIVGAILAENCASARDPPGALARFPRVREGGRPRARFFARAGGFPRAALGRTRPRGARGDHPANPAPASRSRRDAPSRARPRARRGPGDVPPGCAEARGGGRRGHLRLDRDPARRARRGDHADIRCVRAGPLGRSRDGARPSPTTRAAIGRSGRLIQSESDLASARPFLSPPILRRDPPPPPARRPHRRVARPPHPRRALPLPRTAQDAYPRRGDGGVGPDAAGRPPRAAVAAVNAAAESRPSRAPLHLVDALALVGDAFGCASDIEAAVAASAFETHNARGETRGPAGAADDGRVKNKNTAVRGAPGEGRRGAFGGQLGAGSGGVSDADDSDAPSTARGYDSSDAEMADSETSDAGSDGAADAAEDHALDSDQLTRLYVSKRKCHEREALRVEALRASAADRAGDDNKGAEPASRELGGDGGRRRLGASTPRGSVGSVGRVGRVVAVRARRVLSSRPLAPRRKAPRPRPRRRGRDDGGDARRGARARYSPPRGRSRGSARSSSRSASACDEPRRGRRRRARRARRVRLGRQDHARGVRPSAGCTRTWTSSSPSTRYCVRLRLSFAPDLCPFYPPVVSVRAPEVRRRRHPERVCRAPHAAPAQLAAADARRERRGKTEAVSTAPRARGPRERAQRPGGVPARRVQRRGERARERAREARGEGNQPRPGHHAATLSRPLRRHDAGERRRRRRRRG